MKLRSLEDDAKAFAELANKQAARIREQRDLLDECERLIAGGERYTSELGHRKLVLNHYDAQATLDKLRGHEKADGRS